MEKNSIKFLTQSNFSRNSVIETLLSKKSLDQKFNDHSLSGKWKNHRDFHIEPDWLLIYRITSESLILERTGSHFDLFK